jgi:hypothetical protein
MRTLDSLEDQPRDSVPELFGDFFERLGGLAG